MATRLKDTQGCLNFLLRRTARIVGRHYDAALRPSGLKATQFNVMAVLAQAGPTSLTKLADLLGMERSALARNLAPLERSGYVASQLGKDRRVRIAELTRRGDAKLANALPLWAQAQAQLASELNQRDLSRLATILNKLTDQP